MAHPYNAIQSRNELSSHKKISWINFKYILLIEEASLERTLYYMILITWYSGKGKIIETVKLSVAAQSGGKQEEERICEVQENFRVVKLFCMTL